MVETDKFIDGHKAATVMPENRAQVAVLGLLGRAAPVGVLAASAVVAWCANSTFWLVLTTLGAAFFSWMLGLHFIFWRLECRRARTRGELERVPHAG
jgi:hypothetical protein